jgi:Protein of unknown function (DUF4241)
MPPQPPDFEPMFRPGVRYRVKRRDQDPGEEAVVEVRDAGLLHLATGRLVACSPRYLGGIDPLRLSFRVTVPPGRYPVTVSIARFDRLPFPAARPTRVGAAARLIVRDEPVARWERAARGGDDPEAVLAGQVGGLPASYGVGAFFDASALAALGPMSELGPPPELDDPAIDEILQVEFAEGNEQVVNLVVDETADLNAILFDCGTGPNWVWLGRTAAGEPACFVAEFGVLSRDGSGPITD